MNTPNPFVGLMVLTCAIVSSCQKDQTVPNSSGSSTYTTELVRGPLYVYQLERDAEGDDKCPLGGDNCTKITMLTTGTAEAVYQVLSVLREGDPNDIADTFRENSDALMEFMKSTDVDDVIDLQLGARTSYNEVEEADYIVMTGASGDLRAYRVHLEL